MRRLLCKIYLQRIISDSIVYYSSFGWQSCYPEMQHNNMAEVKRVALLFLFIGNLIIQLTAALVNLVNNNNKQNTSNCYSSPKRVEKAIKKAFKKRLNRRPPRKQRIWCRPGRTNIWWTNILKNRNSSEEWKENLRMNRRLFDELCDSRSHAKIGT